MPLARVSRYCGFAPFGTGHSIPLSVESNQPAVKFEKAEVVKSAHGKWGDFLSDASESRLKGNKCGRKRGASVGTIWNSAVLE